MKKCICLIFCMLFLGSFASAQNEETEQEYSSQQLGLTYSTLGGAGIHYLLAANTDDNVKFTGIYIYSNERDYKESYFSLGVEYQRDLVEEDNLRGYLAAGGHIDNSMSDDLYFSTDSQNESYFNMGAGLGVDFGAIKKGLIINAHITYQLTTGMGSTSGTRVGLGGGVGVGFNF